MSTRNMVRWQFLYSILSSVLRSSTDYTSPAGSIARIGPNMLVTSDPEIVHHMSGARSRYTKGEWYLGMRLQPGHTVFFR
jgi:hypothetical protein